MRVKTKVWACLMTAVLAVVMLIVGVYSVTSLDFKLSGNIEYVAPVKVLDFTFSDGAVTSYTGTDTDIVIPSSYSIRQLGEEKPLTGYTITENDGDFATYKLINIMFLNDFYFEGTGYPKTLYTDWDDFNTRVLENAGVDGLMNLSSALPISIEAEMSFEITLEDCNTEFSDNPFGLDGVSIGYFKFFTAVASCNSCYLESNGAAKEPVTTVREFMTSETCQNMLVLILGAPEEIVPIMVEGVDFQIQYCEGNDIQVTSIGENSFYGCTGITYVILPESIELIDECAFQSCTNLSSINIPDSVTNIGYQAFIDCASLNNVEFGENSQLSSIGENAFWRSGLISIELPFGLTSIGGSAFSVCTKLTSVKISSSVTSMGSSVFSSCTGLTSVTIGEGVTCLGESAFYACISLTSIVIPDSVMSIDNFAFQSCSGLISVTIGEGVTSIGDYAFDGCSGLTSITIPDSVTNIGYQAFGDCSGLTSMNYLGTIEKWCNIRFENSLSNPTNYTKSLVIQGETITDLVIPNSVVSVGTYAFYNCTGLASITIGEDVTSIGDYAFYGCTGLTEINYNAVNVTELWVNNYIFSNAGESETGIKVTFGESVESIPAYLLYPSSISSYYPNIKSVIIGSNVNSIGNCAFYGCSTLENVYYRGTEEQWNAITIGGYNTNLTNLVPVYNYEG